MKKVFAAVCFLATSLAYRGSAQMTATDFTINDCSGVSHHLFGELDGGKIIVAVFVMPCSGCMIPSIDAQNVVQSFATSHPGRVEMYLVDDDGLTTCSELNSWRNSNGLHIMPTFSDPAFVQTQYGTPGMPKVVVLGGTDHKVYDNQNNTFDMEQLRNGINAALGIPSSTRSVTKSDPAFSISPNPATSSAVATVSVVSDRTARFSFVDKSGRVVKTKSVQLTKGLNTISLELSGLSQGEYIVRLSSGSETTEARLIVR
ncbi:MAG: T9SS type A sorting domain-containing protein [Chitinophagaceae bacterium]|nr:T9SS type A sorting domain-containing protein [Chitinophagaceae bacterium]